MLRQTPPDRAPWNGARIRIHPCPATKAYLPAFNLAGLTARVVETAPSWTRVQLDERLFPHDSGIWTLYHSPRSDSGQFAWCLIGDPEHENVSCRKLRAFAQAVQE